VFIEKRDVNELFAGFHLSAT